MSAILPTSILSDLVLRNVSLIPVLSRFGIPLGMGNATVSEVCETYKIDLQFFLFVCNSFLDPSYSGTLTLTKEHIHLTVEYLERANQYYLQAQVPNIRIHLTSFLKRSDSDPTVASSIMRLLTDLECSVEENVREDEVKLFPKFRKLQEDVAFRIHDWTYPAEGMEQEDGFQSSKNIVEDLMQILIRYIKGSFDRNLLHGVIFALSSFRNDLESNSRLRVRVFFPIIEALNGQLIGSKEV